MKLFLGSAKNKHIRRNLINDNKKKNVNQYFIIRHNILFLRFEYKRNLKLIKIFYSFLRAKSIDVKKHSRISEDYSFNMRAPTFIHVDI